MIEAIRKASTEGRYISSSMAEKLLFGLETKQELPVHELLSDWEYQVLCMVSRGKTVSEIAKDLALSVRP